MEKSVEKYGVGAQDTLIALLPKESQDKLRKAIEYSAFIDEGPSARELKFGTHADSMVYVSIEGRQHYAESAVSIEEAVDKVYSKLRGYVIQKRGTLKKKVNDSNDIKAKAETALKELDALLGE